MFYLETKDGEKFFTDKNSDDLKEFDKIIDSKLGRDASNMFLGFIEEAKAENGYVIEYIYGKLDGIIYDLEHVLNQSEVDKIRLSDVLSDLQELLTSI